VLARAADTLWDADNITARNLFTRAWEAAEAGDADEVTIKTKDNPPEMVLALRRMSGHDLRVEVLSLVSRRDKALGEQLFAKLKTQNTGEAKSADTRANVFSGPEADTKRMLVAYKLLADDQVVAARDFAAPALTRVNSQSINFLSLLRAKDAAAADKIFSDLLARVEADPRADANTISALSSYAFTPGLYIVFGPDGNSTWTQPEEPIVPPNLPAALRARFFQVAASVLLRPLPPPNEDTSSSGREGRLKVITRLLPLFEQYAPESAAALRSQLTAGSNRRSGPDFSLLTEGIKPESTSVDNESIQAELNRAKTSAERDQITAANAVRLAPTANKRARDFADAIDDSKLRAEVRNFVDFDFILVAIQKKNAAEVAQLAGAGELTHAQRSWAYTQSARLLLESDRDRALELLEKAIAEAERIDAGDYDGPLAFIAVANQLFPLDRTRAWEVWSKAVKSANTVEDFTGDDLRAPRSPRIDTISGMRFANFPGEDFSVSRLIGALTEDDLYRSVEVAKTFKYEIVRANATLAIAKTILAKPIPSATKN
jgi:hypothetical protein